MFAKAGFAVLFLVSLMLVMACVAANAETIGCGESEQDIGEQLVIENIVDYPARFIGSDGVEYRILIVSSKLKNEKTFVVRLMWFKDLTAKIQRPAKGSKVRVCFVGSQGCMPHTDTQPAALYDVLKYVSERIFGASIYQDPLCPEGSITYWAIKSVQILVNT